MKHLIGDKKRPHQFINWVKLGLSLCLSTSVIASQTAPVFAELEAIPEELQILRTEPWTPWGLGVEAQVGSTLSGFALIVMPTDNWQWGAGILIHKNSSQYISLQSRYYLPAALIPEELKWPFHRLYLELGTGTNTSQDIYFLPQIGLESRLLGSSSHVSMGLQLFRKNFPSPEWELTPHFQVGVGSLPLPRLSEEHQQKTKAYTRFGKRLQLSSGVHFLHIEFAVPSFQDWTLWYQEPQWGIGFFAKSNIQRLAGAGLVGRWYWSPRQPGFNPFVEVLGYTGARDGKINNEPFFSTELFFASKLGLEWQILPGLSLDIGLGAGLMVSPFENTTVPLYKWDALSGVSLPVSFNINFSLPVTEPSSALPAPDIKAPDPRTDQNQPRQFESGL